jgi:hypothetical protein
VCHSPVVLCQGYYHQVILMSGTDLSLYGVGKPFYRPRDYAKNLSQILGCPTTDSYVMISCLRDNSSHTWEDIVRAQEQILPHVSSLFGGFSNQQIVARIKFVMTYVGNSAEQQANMASADSVLSKVVYFVISFQVFFINFVDWLILLIFHNSSTFSSCIHAF